MHRLRRLTWNVLHPGVSYEERGQILNPRAIQRKERLVRALQAIGFQVHLTPVQPATE